MRHLRQGLRLLFHPRLAERGGIEPVVHQLDRDLAIELGIVSQEYDAHAALAEAPNDDIATDARRVLYRSGIDGRYAGLAGQRRRSGSRRP